MSIDDRVKAPEGKFAVFVWDAESPERSAKIVFTKTTRRPAVYESSKFAGWYASVLNKAWEKSYFSAKPEERIKFGEPRYFVLNDQGLEI